jgi:hypothetical protein
MLGDELLDVVTAAAIALRSGNIQHRGFPGHLSQGYWQQ